MTASGITNKSRAYLLVVLCITSVSVMGSPAPRSVTSQPKAIVILMDGIPADVLESVDTPTIDAISAEGGYRRGYVGGTIGAPSESPTISAVGYQTMLTGTWANKHNVYNNDIEAPNYAYWDFFRIAKTANPQLKTALFSTWEDNRTKLLGDGLAEAGGHKLDYFYDGLEHQTAAYPHDAEANYIKAIDQAVAEDAVRHIKSEAPDLSWLYLQYTDDVGHALGDSEPLRQAVADMDNLLSELWQTIISRADAHNEDWLVLVTTDHGRDAKTGKHHGAQSARERTIWIAANHPQLDTSKARDAAMVDILPTLLEHLQIKAPTKVAEQLDGRSLLIAP